MIPKSTRERWRGLSERSSPGAHTVVMCNIDGCVYVKGHGGEHLPPEGNRDMSDEIRLRVLRDRCERLREMPEAMSQLLDENDRLRELVREMCGIAVMSLNHLDRCAEAKAARIAAVASEIGDE